MTHGSRFERGARILPVNVDADGRRVAELPILAEAPTLVYATPSHPFPLGSRLSLPRRRALLTWAHEQDSWIIEDDYDGEFRYDAAPLPALASLDPARGCTSGPSRRCCPRRYFHET